MSEEINPIEEQMLDVLLHEVHGQSAPRDLTNDILAQLGPPSSTRKPTSDSGIQVASIRRKRHRGRSYRTIAAVVAGVAACALLLFWMQTPDGQGDGGAVANSIDPVPTMVAEQSPTETVSPDEPRSATKKPLELPRGVPLIAESNGSDSDTATPRLMGANPAERPLPSRKSNPVQPIDLIAGELAQNWDDYWTAMGVQPTEEASEEQTASRLSGALGASVSSVAISDPKRLRGELNSNDLPKQFAMRWLDQITEGATKRLKAADRQALVNEVADGFRQSKSFDRHFVKLISGQSDQASTLYSAFANGGHDAMVRRLALVSMNVDLRCTKCHDALIEGSGRQDAYWSFSSFIRQGVQRARGGTWSVLPELPGNQPAFYELPDGRQRFVEPVVDASWMPSKLGETGETVQQWSASLVGSPELARGVVNSLWQVVHGRPLRGHVIDTITAPHHELLAEIEGRLSQDLLDSDFDIRRTMALVIASPVSRRSVPPALQPQNNLQSSNQEILNAMNTVDAFAASLPAQSRLSLADRVEVAMKSVGGSLRDVDGAEALANIAIGSSPAGRKSLKSPKLSPSIGYPHKATGLPVQWLSSIESYEAKVDHLGYLAGLSEIPPAVHDVSEMIRAAEGGDELALNRVWWLLRP